MKICITAGGGGHFAPALAVIKALPQDVEVLLIGRKYAFEGDDTISLEYRTAKSLGLPFQSITTARLQRSFTRHTIPSLTKFPVGFIQARKILKSFKPDVVMSFGGYVAVPVTLAAKSLSIPVVIHEQTLDVGLANKIAARFAHTVCLSWEESKKSFTNNNIVITGNPLREEILRDVETSDALPGLDQKKPLIYVTGGSLGSHFINMLIKEAIEELTENVVVFHQTGDAQEFHDYEALQAVHGNLPKDKKDRYILTKFVNPASVGELMRSATIVIARSGINTISELLYLNKPGILIPLPFGQNNEQKKNAVFFQNVGLGVMLEQEGLTAEKLVATVHEVLLKKDSYSVTSETRKHLIHTDAAGKIKDILLHVAKETKTSKRS